MRMELFFEQFGVLAEAPGGVAKLRELILRLAVRGKLVPQEPNDEPASRLVERVRHERARLVASNQIKDSIRLEPIRNEDVLFAIPRSWEWVRAGDVCWSISSGTTPPQDVFQLTAEGGVPFLKVYNIRNQIIDFEYYPQFVSKSYHSTKMRRSVLVPGDVIMNIVGPPLGKVGIIPSSYPEWNCNQAIVFFRLIEPLLPAYLHTYLKEGSYLRNIALVGSAGQDNISVTKSKNIVIAIPPLAEQRRIVAKVDELMAICDELEAKQKAKRETRDRLVASALDKLTSARDAAEFDAHWHRIRDHFDLMFDHPTAIAPLRQAILQLAVQGRLSDSHPNDEPVEILLSKLAAQRTRSEGRARRTPTDSSSPPESRAPFELPKTWAWVTFDELAATVEYGTSHKASKTREGVPVLRMNNIRDGRVWLDDLKYVPSVIEDLPRLLLKSGDILFNRTNSFELVGKVGVFDGPDGEYTFASYLIRAAFLSGVVPEFVNIAMNARYFRKTQIEPEVTQQCGQANFNGTKLRNTMIPLPPKAEQERIVSRVAKLMAVCNRLEDALVRSESTRENLLSSSVANSLNGTFSPTL
jgi:type I restriction enzyme, S subunit